MTEQEKEIVDIKSLMAELAMSTKVNTENISSLTRDIKELTKDLRASSCSADRCKRMEARMEKAEESIENFKDIPNKLMFRSAMTLVTGIVVFIMASIGMK